MALTTIFKVLLFLAINFLIAGVGLPVPPKSSFGSNNTDQQTTRTLNGFAGGVKAVWPPDSSNAQTTENSAETSAVAPQLDNESGVHYGIMATFIVVVIALLVMVGVVIWSKLNPTATTNGRVREGSHQAQTAGPQRCLATSSSAKPALHQDQESISISCRMPRSRHSWRKAAYCKTGWPKMVKQDQIRKLQSLPNPAMKVEII